MSWIRTKSEEELIERLNALRGGPPAPPSPPIPLSDRSDQLKSDILISTNFLKSYLTTNDYNHLKSVVFSPSVISNSLAFLISGAANKEVFNEIKNIFGEDFCVYDDDKLSKGLEIVKTLIYSKNLTISQSFVNQWNKNDKVVLLPIDFENLEENLKQLNSNESINYKNAISKIFNEHHFNSNASLCFGNYVSFVDNWAFPFEKPKPAMFYSNPPRKIEMIRQKEGQSYRFSEGEDWTSFNISYGKTYRKLYIILPKEKDGLQKVIEKFDYSMILDSMERAPPVFATATLPVFEIESTTILNDKLKSLGITQLFGGNQNCFDKLFAKNNESSSHALDIFVHTAKFKTDQFGADGRDSTEDYLRYEDVRPQPGDISDDPRCPRIEFIADHPFIYFLALWGPGNHQSRKLELLSIQFAGIFS